MEKRIPFAPAQETGWSELAGAGGEAMNVVIDGKGAVRRRPGIAPYFNSEDTALPVSDPVSGLHASVGGRTFLTTKNLQLQPLFRITRDNVFDLDKAVVGDNRPTFAETQTLIVSCAGTRLVKVDLSTDAAENLGGSPPKSTHVVANASRLASIEVTNPDLRDNFNYSAPQTGTGIAGYETWQGAGGSDSGPFPSNARPDPIVALHENTNELFAFGSTNLQLFSPDPQSVYAPTNTREFGCIAPYSVIKDDQSFAWLDHLRRIVHSDGRSFKVISDPIKQVLDDMVRVDDAFGYRVVRGAVDALVWVFPSDGRTFAFQRGGGWAQWSSWNAASNGWGQFAVSALTTEVSTGANIVGTLDGRVGELRNSEHTDLGSAINAHVTTGFINHDTSRRKNCRAVRVVMKRGANPGPNAPVAQLTWRDGLGDWGQPLMISLGDHSERDIVVQLRSLGVYRERQWRFTFMGNEELVLGSVIETFDVLED
jgi:hypothetical protein